MHRQVLGILAIAFAWMAAASWTSHPDVVHAQTSAVTIQNFAFQPTPLTVTAGTTVTWTNKDSAPHTSTADPGDAVLWDSGLLSTGQSYSFTFTQPGTYTYHCSVHPNMHGTIIVQDAATAAATSTTPAPSATVQTTVTSVPLAAYPVHTKIRTSHVKATGTGGAYAFAPKIRVVKVGTRVIWHNASDAPHTVTSTKGHWKFNRPLPIGKSVRLVFRHPGRYSYYCAIHPNMVGTIVVKR